MAVKKKAKKSKSKVKAKKVSTRVKAKAKKKVSPKKVATKKKVVKKAVAKKKTAKKPAKKKVVKKKAVVKKAAPKKVAVKKAAPKKVGVKKATPKKVKTKKVAPKKQPIKKEAVKNTAVKKETVKKPSIEKAPVKKPTTTKPPKVRSTQAVMLPSTSQEIDVKPYAMHKGEEYMNAEQKEHFREILLRWKEQLMGEVDSTVGHMKEDATSYADPIDRASQEEGFNLELRTRDRERRLIKKIEQALDLIETGDYGFCEDCGMEIGVRRLEARPTAEKCIDCKTFEEIREKQEGM